MKTETILIVEDDFLNRRLIRKVLHDLSFVVFEAKNSEEAFAVLEKENINLIILDINLGEKQQDGISLGYDIKKNYAIPFIYLTAYETSDIINKAVGTSPLSYLTKPFKNIDLLASVELALAKSCNVSENKLCIVVKQGEYNVNLPFERIDYIEADGNYLCIHSNYKVYKCRSTIKQLLEVLPKKIFFQTHRAFIVNKNKIDMFSTNSLIIKNSAIPVSKNFVSNIHAVYEFPNDEDKFT